MNILLGLFNCPLLVPLHPHLIHLAVHLIQSWSISTFLVFLPPFCDTLIPSLILSFSQPLLFNSSVSSYSLSDSFPLLYLPLFFFLFFFSDLKKKSLLHSFLHFMLLLSAGLSQHHQLQWLHVRLLLSARSKCLHLSQLCWLPSLCNWPPAPQICIHPSWTNLIQVNPDKLSCHDAILQTLLFFLLLFFSHRILSYLLSLSHWFQYIHSNLLPLSWWPFTI